MLSHSDGSGGGPHPVPTTCGTGDASDFGLQLNSCQLLNNLHYILAACGSRSSGELFNRPGRVVSVSSGANFVLRGQRLLTRYYISMATLGTGAPKESTEWDDILKSKGIIPEKTPEELAEEQLKNIVEETIETYDPHERKTVEQLDEDLEEADSDEERILESYRQKRIQQMKAESMRPKFGPGVQYVPASEWKAEVTEAGAGIYVIVHLVRQSEHQYSSSLRALGSALTKCKLMDARLLELSAKFRHTKFVKCKATDAIKNYPDSRCPTLLVYKEGKVLKQFVGFSDYNTSTPVADDIEWVLSKTGAVHTDLEEPPSAATKRFNLRRF
ncbi:phosducin [Gracilaria domingensis]|nr:phosducin [Gracilaria domingensis]